MISKTAADHIHHAFEHAWGNAFRAVEMSPDYLCPFGSYMWQGFFAPWTAPGGDAECDDGPIPGCDCDACEVSR
jgi:hypothetical protein